MFALTARLQAPPRGGRPIIWQRVLFHPRSTLLLALDKAVYVWDVRRGEQVGMIGSLADVITTFALSPDGILIALGTVYGTAAIWRPYWRDLSRMNVPSAARRRVTEIMDFEGRMDSVAFHPHQPVTAWKDMYATTLWSIDGTPIRTLLANSRAVDHLTYTPDGRRLINGSMNEVHIRRATDGRRLRVISLGGLVRGLAVHPDGSRVACASWDGEVTVWDLRGDQVWRVPRLHQGGTWTVAYSPDGSLLASAGLDKEIRVWDTQSGEQVDALTGSVSPVMSVAFDHTGTLLASTDADGVLNIWSRHNSSTPY